MSSQVAFPAPAQAHLADANAAKQPEEDKTQEQMDGTKEPSDDSTSASEDGPTPSGEVPGLNLSARQWILGSVAKITIGRGSPRAFEPLVKNVNLAILEYYIPYLVANHAYALPGRVVILLPESMGSITQRGLRFVVNNMKREMEKGSYTVGNPKEDELEEATSMIRPGPNPVDMVHALNTLRALGLSDDARFLAMEGGPIMAGLHRRALQWDGPAHALKRFLKGLGRKLLADSDQHLLGPAWAVYGERVQANKLQPEAPGREA